MVEDLGHQVVLGVPMNVKAPLGHAGAFSHVFHGEVNATAGAQQLAHRPKDGFTAPLADAVFEPLGGIRGRRRLSRRKLR